MPDIQMRLGRDVLVLDGAMGTMLHKHDLPEGQSLVLSRIRSGVSKFVTVK